MLFYFVGHYTRLYWRTWFHLLQPFLFFSLVLLLFHLLLKDQQQLTALLPALLLITILLANLLSLDTLFKTSLTTGIVDHIFLSAYPTYPLTLAITFAHWLNHGFLLSILALPWLLSPDLTTRQMLLIILVIMIFTANLTLIGMFTSALTAAIQENGLLLSVISIPLYLPNLIFSFESYQSIVSLIFYPGSLAFLSALFCFNLAVLPIATHFALANSNA